MEQHVTVASVKTNGATTNAVILSHQHPWRGRHWNNDVRNDIKVSRRVNLNKTVILIVMVPIGTSTTITTQARAREQDKPGASQTSYMTAQIATIVCVYYDDSNVRADRHEARRRCVMIPRAHRLQQECAAMSRDRQQYSSDYNNHRSAIRSTQKYVLCPPMTRQTTSAVDKSKVTCCIIYKRTTDSRANKTWGSLWFFNKAKRGISEAKSTIVLSQKNTYQLPGLYNTTNADGGTGRAHNVIASYNDNKMLSYEQEGYVKRQPKHSMHGRRRIIVYYTSNGQEPSTKTDWIRFSSANAL